MEFGGRKLKDTILIFYILSKRIPVCKEKAFVGILNGFRTSYEIVIAGVWILMPSMVVSEVPEKAFHAPPFK